jgi:hypothetical protein
MRVARADAPAVVPSALTPWLPLDRQQAGAIGCGHDNATCIRNQAGRRPHAGVGLAEPWRRSARKVIMRQHPAQVHLAMRPCRAREIRRCGKPADPHRVVAFARMPEAGIR